jgi:hypothetical protein
MLEKLQKDNAEKLEKMRETVDEKLNKTLEERLTQKFQLISSQFETVQKGFGEMQGLVSGVDELKRALSNVKTRGIMGEMLEHMAVTPEAFLQHRLAVVLVPAPQDMIVGARHHADRVELNKSQLSDRTRKIHRPGRRR